MRKGMTCRPFAALATRRLGILAAAVAIGTAGLCLRRSAGGLGLVRIAVPYEVATLDPHAEGKLGSFAVLCNLYESLVRMDSEMRIRPALAESWESPDPLTWDFHLRRNVRFHGGARLGAADVVYSFERLLHNPRLEARSYVADIESIGSLDEATVRIRTRMATRIFVPKLSYVSILREGQGDASLDSFADGTGPYRLVEWVKGERLRLRRNGGYWGEVPRIPEVEVHLGRGPEEALQGLLAGRYQLVKGDSPQLEAVAGRSARFAVSRRDNLFGKYLAFDLSRETTPFCSVRPNPFRDPRVRRAIHLGIDRQRLAGALWNHVVPATQPVPRSIFGFDPRLPEPVHDPVVARALLARAGLSSGFDVTLHTRPVVAAAANLVAEDLRQIGIRAEVRMLQEEEFFELVEGGGATLWLSRFGCMTGDATEFLYDVVHSPDPQRQLGSTNYGGHANADLDHAVQGIASVEDLDRRRNAIQTVMRRVMDDLVVIPLYNDQDVYALDRRLAWRPRSDSYVTLAEVSPQP